MPPIDKHVQESNERTGKDYREIHEWIDNPETKLERQDLSRVLEFGEMFRKSHREEWAREYVRHLRGRSRCLVHHAD